MPFVKGKSGNPSGPHVGTRRRINERFLRGMLKAYEEGGDEAILRVMHDDPAKFIAVCASLLPKEANLGINVTHTLVDVLQNVIDTSSRNRPDTVLEDKSGKVRH